MGVDSVIAGVSLPGLTTDPYTVEPAVSVISTRLNPPDVPDASETVTVVMLSVLLAVWKVKASAMVAAPPGARVVLPGSVPFPSVVVEVTETLAPNSEVLLLPSVAVAVIWSPSAKPLTVSDPLMLPLASEVRKPRYVCPSPFPLASRSDLKISTRAAAKVDCPAALPT